MAVPTNPKMSEIQTEFGGSNPIQLSEYYRGGPNVPSDVTSPNGPIATSGTITMGSFRSAAAVTVVSLDYLVIAGGGGGGGSYGGGGGAGGFRTSFPGGTTIDLNPGDYSITIGGAGNTPPVSPSQGNSGGSGTSDNASYRSGGGGGGHTAVGQAGGNNTGGAGGAGTANSINGSSVARGGGGGGGVFGPNPGNSGGSGGGGAGGNQSTPGATAGTANTGGGGGGGIYEVNSANGGSGIVIIRSPAGAPLSVAPGTNSTSTTGGDTVATFTVSGTLTVN